MSSVSHRNLHPLTVLPPPPLSLTSQRRPCSKLTGPVCGDQVADTQMISDTIIRPRGGSTQASSCSRPARSGIPRRRRNRRKSGVGDRGGSAIIPHRPRGSAPAPRRRAVPARRSTRWPAGAAARGTSSRRRGRATASDKCSSFIRYWTELFHFACFHRLAWIYRLT